MTNELLTTDELALELGIKPQTLRLWRTKSRNGRPSGPNGESFVNPTTILVLCGITVATLKNGKTL